MTFLFSNFQFALFQFFKFGLNFVGSCSQNAIRQPTAYENAVVHFENFIVFNLSLIIKEKSYLIFNETCLRNDLLPVYTNIYIYMDIYIYNNI